MRVLQARFYPQETAIEDFVVVGHVVWDRDVATGPPTVQPSLSLMRSDMPATMLSKLQYLVAVAEPESFERLLNLKSRFWSFVEVSSTARGGD